MTSSEAVQQWLNRLSKAVPVLTPSAKLPSVNSSVDDFYRVIAMDPLLALQVFYFVNRLRKEAQPDKAGGHQIRTLKHALTLIGTQKLYAFCAKLPRLDQEKTQNQRLLKSLSDSLVATSLLKSWHNWRHVEWLDADHWACLFDRTGWWVMSWLDPMVMEGIEYRVNQGEDEEHVFRECFGFGSREWDEAVIQYYHLPSVAELSGLTPDSSKKGEEEDVAPAKNFKYSALNYYLPKSFQLAAGARSNWGSPAFAKQVERAENATLIDNFDGHLSAWLAAAAHSSPLSYVSEAIRTIFLDQPNMFLANDGRTPVKPVNGRKRVKATRGNNRALQQQVDKLQAGSKEGDFEHQDYEILLDALHEGMGLSRCFVALFQPVGQIVRVEYGRGMENFLLLEQLSFRLQNDLVSKLCIAGASLWVQPNKAEKLLPQCSERFQQATHHDDFFLRAIHLNGQLRALIFADNFEQKAPLTEKEYQLFKRLVSLLVKVLTETDEVSS